MESIANKVSESGLITYELQSILPDENSIMVFDLKPFLFREMILKEKDYRAALKIFDWSIFAGKHVAILCSADAIIPVWAFMLAASYLNGKAISTYFGSKNELLTKLIFEAVDKMDVSEFIDKRIVIKGCGDDHKIPEAAYVAITNKFVGVVKSLMYGEPCSTVPIFKKSNES